MRNTLLTLAASGLSAASAFAGFVTSEPSYVLPAASSNYTFTPVVTVGDYVQLTGGAPTARFAMVGIPDAMGLYKDPVTQENILFLAHELGGTTLTTPVFGGTALRGAWVSRYVLDFNGGVVSVTSGNVAHGALFNENTLLRATPPDASVVSDVNGVNSFNRFCSGAFAGPAQGMDRPMFLTNEESGPSFGGNYSTRGSQSVAIIDGKMHMLPDLGSIPRETTVVMPRRDAITAIISTEDDGGDSAIYLYVGQKQRRSSDVLAKNGLVDGKVYVLRGVGVDAGKTEATFNTASGTVQVGWAEIVGAGAMTDVQLKAAALERGSFQFVRVEDAEFDPVAPTRTMFVASTGGSTVNRLGRLYKLNFNPTNPAANGTMEMIYNADQIITPGGIYAGTTTSGFYNNTGTAAGNTTVLLPNGIDYPVSVDNIAVTATTIVICEDRNSPADAVFSRYGRNGGVWTLDRNNNYAAKYQGNFNYAYVNGREGAARTAGLWEASGVIDASSMFGAGTFLINVQAHGASPSQDRSNISIPTGGTYSTTLANSLFAEDGQVILMKVIP
ncbi:MAG: hypothetical protein H7067_02990 [Burkholderiales bacterium]|nr:hypothetical protein [Opitutaceae bacterium]